MQRVADTDLLVFDQIYSFDRDAVDQIDSAAERNARPRKFEPATGELFDRLMQLADNAGATDDHRAVNYLAVRYPAIYAKAAEAVRARTRR